MKTLILVGGGHAHLYIVRALLQEKVNFHIVLISPSRYQYYSGMFSGYAEGVYSEKDIRIDLKDLCERANISFLQESVDSFDPHLKKVLCKSGKSLPFDLISFDVGSKSETNPSFQNHVVPIKPNYLFPKHIEDFKRSLRPVVIGGGAAGIELALSMLSWRKTHLEQENVTLISSSRLLSSFGFLTSNKMKQIAKVKGLNVMEGEKVKNITSNYVETEKQNRVNHTGVLLLTGPKSFDLFQKTNVETDEKGFLVVNDHLQSVSYPFVFGAGDCVSIIKYINLPKNGVYAVRQAPILWENIKNYMVGLPLAVFKPQKKFVAIISTGNKEALFTYGRLSFHSKLAWNLKHYIDQKYINKNT
ncbi:FAD-dependent oxidoreductase [Bacillaceae bacterium S4-13-58]